MIHIRRHVKWATSLHGTYIVSAGQILLVKWLVLGWVKRVTTFQNWCTKCQCAFIERWSPCMLLCFLHSTQARITGGDPASLPWEWSLLFFFVVVNSRNSGATEIVRSKHQACTNNFEGACLQRWSMEEGMIPSPKCLTVLVNFKNSMNENYDLTNSFKEKSSKEPRGNGWWSVE